MPATLEQRPSHEAYSRALQVLSVLASLWCAIIAGAAIAQTQAAVEYYYADWDYYFETSFADEIALLDGGAFGGVWRRTGQSFAVLPQPGTGTNATCRFFSVSFSPKSSHFYTPFDPECTKLKASPDWQFESIAFHLQLPDGAGNCPAGTKVLYRLYNESAGGAPNHRYTTSVVLFNQMKAAGWTFEGNGLTGAFACVPIFDAEGLWLGSTTDGSTLYAIVLDDASYYIIYTLAGSGRFDGFLQGTMTSGNRQIKSADGRAVIFAAGVVSTTISGTYVPKTSMTGTAVTPGVAVSNFTMTYQPAYLQPLGIPAVAGTYQGTIGTGGAIQVASMTIGSDGTVSGTFGNCGLAGSLSPHGATSVFDLYIATVGAACSFGGKILHTGVAFFDAQNKRLLTGALNPGRGEGFFFAGTKP